MSDTPDMTTLLKTTDYDNISELFDTYKDRLMEALEHCDDAEQMWAAVTDLHNELFPDEDDEDTEDDLDSPDDEDFEE